MSKQLQKLNYAPEEVEISVIGSSTPTTGSLTISQIKTLLASDQNYIKYTIAANMSEYLYFTNFTNNTAFYGADLYNATTSVYYRHLIKISYSSDLSSATWNYYNIPIITGSSSDLQEKLVSGTNIKTINGNSVLGSGNLAISEFPEPSHTDATLAQIAGLNSGGLPDVGKVAAGNVSSTGATNGQVLTADGQGGCAWANASGGSSGYKYTYDLYFYTPFYWVFGGGPDSTTLHYIFKTDAPASLIRTGLLQTINSALSTSFTDLTTVLISLSQMGLTNAQIFSELMKMLSIDNFKYASKITGLGYEFINMYLAINESDGHSNILAMYEKNDIYTAVIYGQIFENNTTNYRIIDLYDISNNGGDFGEISIEVV